MKRLGVLAAIFAFAFTRDVRGAERTGTPRRVDPPIASIVAGSILVRGGVGATSIRGAHRVALLAGSVERWDFDAPLDAAETLARVHVLRDAGFDVEPDTWRSAQKIPDDPDYGKQWALPLVHVDAAWDVTTGDPTLVVAVIDTGIVDHPDLEGRVIAGYDFISDVDAAGDGDGRDPDPHDEGDESPSSSGFHGTHVAGIIGASTGNGAGIAGVDWQCAIQPIRVLGVAGRRGRDSDIADAIRWAAGINVPGVPENQTPAKVINLSFGGPGYSQALQDAVLAALARGSIVIASAGNNGDDAALNFPSGLEGVLAVAAAGPDGALASYSNAGPRVDLMAPGGALFLDSPTDQETPTAILSTSFLRADAQFVYAYEAGTSQAAAFASGVAALVYAAAPAVRPEVVGAVLRRSSSVPTLAGACDRGCGAGLVDAQKAVLDARQIALAECGALGCGDVAFAPAPLRPEEGCTYSSSSSVDARRERRDGEGGFVVVASLAIAAALARRRARRSRAPFLALLVSSFFGCASSDGVRQAQSTSLPLSVRIVDPIPTLSSSGDLEISVGSTGVALSVDVVPAARVEQVTLHAPGDDTSLDRTFGTLGHAPFAFTLPADAPGPDGRRYVCLTALDDEGGSADTCFYAVK